MKVFVALASLLVMASAAPSGLFYNAPLVAAPAVVAAPAAVYNQHHAQDEFGQYAYGYSGGPSSKYEAKSLDGVTRGSYSYYDANGKLQTVSYTADALHGFRVAATNLPEAPVDTNVAPVDTNTPPTFDGQAPEPVTETPEVAKATAEHLAAVEEAKKRNELAEKEIKVEEPVVVHHSLPAVQHIAAPVAVQHAVAAPVAYHHAVAAPAAVEHVAPYHYGVAPYHYGVAPYHYGVAPYKGGSFAYSNTVAEFQPAFAYHHGHPYGYSFAAPWQYSAPVEVLKH